VIAITAFPALCRILASLNLVNANVGVITLTSGIANDVIGGFLLALCVTLVNAGNGITALYVLLVATGSAIFLAFAVRPAVVRVCLLCRKRRVFLVFRLQRMLDRPIVSTIMRAVSIQILAGSQQRLRSIS
jgi:Kef-type K+ transport system membrane component KefB